MPRSAHAQDDFTLYLNTAVHLYKSGESERALEQLKRAKQHASKVEQDVAVALYEGIILADLGQSQESLAAFETGLLLNPEAKLPLKVSPKQEREFEALRGRVRTKLGLGKPPARAEPPKVANAPLAPSPAPTPADAPPKTPTPPAVSTTGKPGQAPVEPKLDPPTPPAPEPYMPASTVAGASRGRVPVAPLVLGGVGVGAAGVGAVFGMQSRSSAAKAREAYSGDRLPSPSELSAVDGHLQDARSQSRVANVLFGTAVLAAGGAVVTWLLASDDAGTSSEGTR